MALSDFEPVRQRKGPGCTAGELVDSLDPSDRKELERWVKERFTWSSISNSLQRGLGQKIGANTLARHFGSPRKCSCSESR